MSKKHEVHLEAKVKIKESVEAWLRSYFSLRYIKSAVYFAIQALEMENQGKEKPSEEVTDRHGAFVTASLFTAVAFLEATINEILRDSYDAIVGTFKEAETYISKKIIPNLARFHEIYKKRKHLSLPRKYQIALELTQKECFEENEELYLNVRHFISLRNKLIHYAPSWAKVEPPEEYVSTNKLAEYLYGKFELNPLVGKGNPFLYDKCLGYGCCKWGIESSLAFTDEFCRRTEVSPKYKNIRSNLTLN